MIFLLESEIVLETGERKKISNAELVAITRAEIPVQQTLRYMQKKVTDYGRKCSETIEEKYNFEIEYWRNIMLYAEDMFEFLEEIMELRKQRPDLFDW